MNWLTLDSILLIPWVELASRRPVDPRKPSAQLVQNLTVQAGLTRNHIGEPARQVLDCHGSSAKLSASRLPPAQVLRQEVAQPCMICRPLQSKRAFRSSKSSLNVCSKVRSGPGTNSLPSTPHQHHPCRNKASQASDTCRGEPAQCYSQPPESSMPVIFKCLRISTGRP